MTSLSSIEQKLEESLKDFLKQFSEARLQTKSY